MTIIPPTDDLLAMVAVFTRLCYGFAMKATRKSYEEAKANLACEGIYLTPEEDEAIGKMIDDGVDEEESIRRITEAFCRKHGIPLPKK
jgi:hypothetical protein